MKYTFFLTKKHTKNIFILHTNGSREDAKYGCKICWG